MVENKQNDFSKLIRLTSIEGIIMNTFIKERGREYEAKEVRGKQIFFLKNFNEEFVTDIPCFLKRKEVLYFAKFAARPQTTVSHIQALYCGAR
jgi:hypothetical protein